MTSEEIIKERHKVFEWIKVNGTHWDAGTHLFDLWCQFFHLHKKLDLDFEDEANWPALKVEHDEIETMYEDQYDEYVRSLNDTDQITQANPINDGN